MKQNSPLIISVEPKPQKQEMSNSIYYPLWLEIIEKIGDANKRMAMEEIARQLCAPSTISMILADFMKLGLVHRDRFNSVWMFSLTMRGRVIYDSVKQMRTVVKYIAPSNCAGARHG